MNIDIQWTIDCLLINFKASKAKHFYTKDILHSGFKAPSKAGIFLKKKMFLASVTDTTKTVLVRKSVLTTHRLAYLCC